MTKIPSPAVFDGHNDLVLRLLRGDVTAAGVADGLDSGQIDVPRAKQGGFGGGFFAIFVPSPGDKFERYDMMATAPYDVPLPEPIAEAEAVTWADRGFDALDDLAATGAIAPCKTAAEVEAALGGDAMAAVFHMEGAEAIDRGFARLHAYHARGLRSLGPVWSRETIWGHGVPFRFPSDPDIGPGLTEDGKALVRECNRLKIMIDLSHLNGKGFDDVARISDAPLVATHSCAWAITPHPRNLTDRQLHAIRDTDGMVGLNFACAFLRPDGLMNADTSLDTVLRHIDHLIETLGEDRVGLGSDFDGAMVPEPISDCAGLPNLTAAMAAHGMGAALIEKIAYKNWLRVLKKTWGA